MVRLIATPLREQRLTIELYAGNPEYPMVLEKVKIHLVRAISREDWETRTLNDYTLDSPSGDEDIVWTA